MGSPVGEACRDATDEILHEVTLTRDFEIAQTEVTQQQFNAILKQQPSSNKTCGSNCPVETVTWHEAASYCNGLSESLAIAKCYKCSGQPPACSEETAYAGAKIYTCPGYRLPTEAEWEYAYRAGTKTSSHGGAITGCATSDAAAGAIGWFSGNSAISIHPVSQKLKNAWGLFDMAGNVYEWANDWYSLSLGAGKASDPWGPATGTNKVVRGGGFNSDARYLRAANREPATGPQSANTGFRCVRSK
jgi:formylglycine-generating enzyme required for sulfatase activity